MLPPLPPLPLRGRGDPCVQCNNTYLKLNKNKLNKETIISRIVIRIEFKINTSKEN
jgi:hypothetical protein